MEINPAIFRAYDVRGIYPDELNERVAERIAGAFVRFLKPRRVAIARDVRLSGPKLRNAAISAFRKQGVDVYEIGIVPIEVFYFAIVHLQLDGGIFITASHNSREWNGMSFARRGARPISSESGLQDIERLARSDEIFGKAHQRGRLVRKKISPAYFSFIRSEINLRKKPLRIVVNGNFGVSARFFRTLVRTLRLPWKLVGLNEKPDGRFPQGTPDPFRPENRRETTALIRRSRADLGIAWDADGDRCFFADENGKFLEGYFTTAILAGEVLRRHPRATILHDCRLTWAVRDVVHGLGGKAIATRPGMTRIAEAVRKHHAVFAGEMSGHFFFKKTWSRDSSFLAIFTLISLMLREGKSLSKIAEPLRKRYFISGELNFPLRTPVKAESVIRRVKIKYGRGKITRIDGLSVEFSQWRFNLRPSNTEPLLRLNVEARDPETLRRETARLSKLIKGA